MDFSLSETKFCNTNEKPANGGKGFESFQYTGFMDMGKSKADVVIESFEELKTILKKKETQNEESTEGPNL